MHMPRLKESEKDRIRGETRALLLNAATDEFARAGYDSANINRISINAGFAKGTIYNYFSSKRALMLDLIDEIAAGHFDFLSRSVFQVDDPVQRMELFFSAGFQWVTDNLSQGRVLFITLNGPDDEFKTRMYMDYQPMFQLLARYIVGEGIEQGLFRPVEPVSTANLIMNIYLGTGSQVNEEGKQWVPAGHVAEFVLTSLQAGVK
jgi:AcrR family transcriptional regulator